MPANYTTLPTTIRHMVQSVSTYLGEQDQKYEKALEILANPPLDQDALRQRVYRLLERIDRLTRCACPTAEPMLAQYPASTLSEDAVLIGVDGSQVMPDPHAGILWGLINTATVQIRLRSPSPQPPEVAIETILYLEDRMYTPEGELLTEENVGLLRDVRERERMAEVASQTGKGHLTYIVGDGKLELWGSRDPKLRGEYKASLEKVESAFRCLTEQQIPYCGYVESGVADLMIRLLEIADAREADLPIVRRRRPLLGVSDSALFSAWLQPGYRTAVFELKTRAQGTYRDELSIHFYYLNVGGPTQPNIARVEIPAWCSNNPKILGQLHALLLEQCRIVPDIPYPYVLMRADEEARITEQEREAIQRMIELEYLKRGWNWGKGTSKRRGKGLV